MECHVPERRHNRVFVTQHHEYHMRDRVCVAVRDRHSRSWKLSHEAVGRKLMGGIAMTRQGCCVHHRSVEVGDLLCFENDLLTTPVESEARPGKNTVSSYPLAALGPRSGGEGHWGTG
jgi:hypothetical protein